MNMTDKQLLIDLVQVQDLAALAAGRPPRVSLVAFAATADLTGIYFVTPRPTRKYRNIKADPRVGLLIDNRTEAGADFESGRAATISGSAEELTGPDRDEGAKIYLARRPDLAAFLGRVDAALFLVRIEEYRCTFGLDRTVVFRVDPVSGKIEAQ